MTSAGLACNKPAGTLAWIARFSRLLERCVAQAAKRDPLEVCQSMEILFALLSRIDECRDDIIFFADQRGTWQIGVDWDRVLPVWFKVPSVPVGPEEFAQRILAMLSQHYSYGRDRMLVIARRTATLQQRKVLAELKSRQSLRE